MELMKGITAVATILLVCVVIRTESKCSVDSSQLAAGCGCPGQQKNILQCTCGNSKLTELPAKELIPNDVTFLLFLNCRFLKIDEVPYTQLESLHIRNSGVDTIKDGAFKNMGKLETLDLSENRLRNLTKGLFLGLDSLNTFVATANNLEQIASDAFEHVSKLEKLELSNNNGLQLPENIFSKMSNLKTVEIRHCNLQSIPTAVTKVPTLTELDLDVNSLQSLSDGAFSSMKSLITLGLDSCALETISDGAFENLHQLKVLNLGHNHINSIHSRYFEAFRDKLEYLYIEHNELKTLSEDVLNWDQVKDAALGHNPWICDCALHWITEKLGSKHNKENVT